MLVHLCVIKHQSNISCVRVKEDSVNMHLLEVGQIRNQLCYLREKPRKWTWVLLYLPFCIVVKVLHVVHFDFAHGV